MSYVAARFRLPVGLTGFLIAAVVGSAAGPKSVDWPNAGEQAALEAISDLFLDQGAVEKNADGTLKSVSYEGRPARENASFTMKFDPKTQRLTQVVGNGAGITNEEYALFAPLSDLTNVTLFHNSPGGDRSLWPTIGDGAGLVNLKGNQDLNTICLAGGPLDDDGLAAIAKLPQVKKLRIWHIAATDAGFAKLRNHPGLESVHVGPSWKPTITDATIEHLSSCPNLNTLIFHEAYLTWDDGLKHLTKLKGTFKTLDVEQALIAPEDLERFRKEMPNVKVIHAGMEELGAKIAANDRKSADGLKTWAPPELIARYIAAANGAK